MTSQTPVPVPSPAFTPAQWQALHALHTRYQQDRDLFSNRERARLRFVRWLYQTSRLVP
jgi:hypothetical protein